MYPWWTITTILAVKSKFMLEPAFGILGLVDGVVGWGLMYGMIIRGKYLPWNIRLCDGYPEDVTIITTEPTAVSWVRGDANRSVVIDLVGCDDKCEDILNGYLITHLVA